MRWKPVLWRALGSYKVWSLLQAYKNLGCKVFASLGGEFSAAIWDQENRMLVLVRDKLGLGFMYYGVFDNVFLFSNNLSTLLKGCEEPNVNYQAILEFFQLGTILPPETILKNIYSIEPGVYVLFDRNNLISQ